MGKVLLVVAAIAFLIECNGWARTVAGCPVAVGDRVTLDGKSGTVRAIEGWASHTHNCRVGVVFDDGTNSGEYVFAWKVVPESTPSGPERKGWNDG